MGHMASKQQQQQQQSGKPSASSLRRDVFPAWSAVEDLKKKADTLGHELGDEVAKEYDIASHKAQNATGHIEPFTPKYYGACIVGGLLACVCFYHTC